MVGVTGRGPTIRIPVPVLWGGLVGWSAALVPGTLPRPAGLAAAVAVVLTLVGIAVGRLIGAVRGPGAEATRGHLAIASTVVITAGSAALIRQESLRAALGAPPAGLGWAAAIVLAPATAALLLVGLPRRVRLALVAVAAVLTAPAATSSAASGDRPNVPDSPSMVYSSLAEDGDRGFDVRADRLVARWADRGDPTRPVVVAVPTGSGWVDASAVAGFEQHFGGRVAVLAMQYSQVASWRAYVSSTQPARRSADAVLRALHRRIAAWPADRRPAVYLYGQSLGAIGADHARARAAAAGRPVTGTVLAGAPAGTVESLPACRRRVVLANATDPVADFSWSLAWRPPRRADVTTVVGAPADRPPWLPALSFVAAAADLVTSLDGPVGTGHHYGAEQGRALDRLPPGCD